LWVTYSVAANVAAEKFDVSLLAVNQLSIVFYVGFLMFSLPASFVFHKDGLKRGLMFGAVLTMSGAWLRYIATVIKVSPHIAFVYTALGQGLAAMGQPFILNSITKFAATWFPAASRGTANTIASMGSPLGFAFGAVLITYLCQTPDQLPRTLLITAIISTVAPLPLLFLTSTPPTPTGPTLKYEAPQSFFRGILEAFKSRGFPILLFCFAVLVGVFQSFGGLLENLITPYGFTSQQAGATGALTIVGGFSGATIMAFLMHRMRSYILLLRFGLPLSALSFSGMFIALILKSYLAVCVVSFFTGFFTFSLLPTALELGVECTFPVPEGTSTGLLWMSSQLASLIIQSIMNFLRAGPNATPPYNMEHAVIFSSSLALFASLLGMFGFRGSERRRHAELAAELSLEKAFKA